MKTVFNKLFIFVVLGLFNVTTLFAQYDEGEEAAEDFQDFIFSIAPGIFAAILIVSALFNIGKIMGDNKDYKGFFVGVGLYVAGLTFVAGIVSFVASMSFG